MSKHSYGHQLRNPASEVRSPATWDLETVQKELVQQLMDAAREEELQLSPRRVNFELQESAKCRELLQQWPDLKAPERVQAWKGLLQSGLDAIRDVTAVCIRCGECCKRGSPTLHVGDLELVRSERIALDQLVTLRKGEPAQLPVTGEAFYLPAECIKLREKPGTKECVFLDASGDRCLIYEHRPAQCRAQACWDPGASQRLAKEMPALTRQQLFEGVDVLGALLEEHERRCSFQKLRDVFDRLQETKGQTMDEVLDAIAFEDHFRTFAAERLSLPVGALDLFFGRSFVDQVRLFGFRVEQEPDGTRVLLPGPECEACGQDGT